MPLKQFCQQDKRNMNKGKIKSPRAHFALLTISRLSMYYSDYSRWMYAEWLLHGSFSSVLRVSIALRMLNYKIYRCAFSPIFVDWPWCRASVNEHSYCIVVQIFGYKRGTNTALNQSERLNREKKEMKERFSILHIHLCVKIRCKLTCIRRCRFRCDVDLNICEQCGHFFFRMSSCAIRCISNDDLCTNPLPHRWHW